MFGLGLGWVGSVPGDMQETCRRHAGGLEVTCGGVEVTCRGVEVTCRGVEVTCRGVDPGMPRPGGDMPRPGSHMPRPGGDMPRPGGGMHGPFHVIERIFLFKNLYLTHSSSPCGSVLGRFCVLLKNSQNDPLVRAK